MTLLPYSADIVNCSKVDSRTPIIFVFFCSNSHQLCLGYAMNGEEIMVGYWCITLPPAINYSDTSKSVSATGS